MGAGFTPVQYRAAVARVLGLATGTATGGSTTAVADSGLVRYANDFFTGQQVYVVTTTDGAAPQGEARYVSAFAQSTGTLTVSPAFTAAVGAGDTYWVFQRTTLAALDHALDLACAGAEVATSLTPSSSTLDYYLGGAPGLYRRQQLHSVWVRAHNDPLALPVEITGWQLEDAEGALTLRLPYAVNADDHLWLIYFMGETGFSSASTINLPLALVRARALVTLLEGLLGQHSGTEADEWGVQLRYWNEVLVKEERAFQRPATRVRGYAWGATSDRRGRNILEDAHNAIIAESGYHLRYD